MGSKEDWTTRPRNRNGHGVRPKIIELASGTGDHLAAYAAEWDGVDWVGSERERRYVPILACPSLVRMRWKGHFVAGKAIVAVVSSDGLDFLGSVIDPIIYITLLSFFFS